MMLDFVIFYVSVSSREKVVLLNNSEEFGILSLQLKLLFRKEKQDESLNIDDSFCFYFNLTADLFF